VNGTYIACGSDDGNCVLIVSQDTGKTWSQHDLNVNLYPQMIDFYDKNNGYMVGGYNAGPAVFKTTDGGNTWSLDEQFKYKQGTNGDDFNNLFGLRAFSPTSVFVCGEQGTIFKRK